MESLAQTSNSLFRDVDYDEGPKDLLGRMVQSLLGDIDYDDVRGACNLIRLSQDTWDDSLTGKRKRDQEQEDLQQSSRKRKETSVVSRSEEGERKKIKEYFFPCKNCGKVFDSHQALGGHRSHHKKSKARPIYECPICLQVFRSYQALGGHKRVHSSSSPHPPPPPPTPEIVNTPTTASSTSNDGRFMILDLSPPSEDY